MNISLQDAKYLSLHNQQLLIKNTGGTKDDLLKIIEAISYVQIDTISIVERAHHHILWTRMPAYKREMLDELQEKDKKIFEYWSHAAALLPMRDFRFTHYRRDKYRENYKAWSSQNRKIIKFVLDRIKAEGPLQSKDFEHTGKKRGAGWWEWKPAKNALEHLFHEGTLMIVSRRGFQKVYDLTERALPEEIDTTLPSVSEYTEHLIMNAVNAGGFAAPKEMTYLRHHEPKVLKTVIGDLVASGKLVEISIDGIQDSKYYSTIENLGVLENKVLADGIQILSPFDNLIIQRKRTSALFGVDFFIEFYLPAPKRKFGYFCMPVFFGTEFIGKVDAKADRAKGTFEVINYFSELKKKPAGELKKQVREKIEKLAVFTGCKKVNWNRKI